MIGESTVEECQVPFPILPLEIHERIIDRVDLNPFPIHPTDNDIKRATLRVFSLVCRAWAIRVRMHLFENIMLKDSNFRRFIRLVRGNPILGYQTLHCHIIAGTYNTSHSAGSTTSCSITSLILVCQKWLPNLTAISFHLPCTKDLLRREHPILPHILKRLSSVRHLRFITDGVKHTTSCGWTDLRGLFTPFKSLTTLSVIDWDTKGWTATNFKMPMRLAALHFRLDIMCIPFVWYLLDSKSLATTLQELHIILVAEADHLWETAQIVNCLEVLIKHCGRSLRRLSLIFPKATEIVGGWPITNIMKYTVALQSFHVAFSTTESPAVSHMLTTYTISSLTHLSISYLRIPRHDDELGYLERHKTDVGHLEQVDRVFVKNPSLWDVRFQEKKWDYKTRSIVPSRRNAKKLLPRLHRRGILHIVDVESQSNPFPEHFR